MPGIASLRRNALEVGFVLFVGINLVAMELWPRWETIPFHLIWTSLTLLYGVRVWRLTRTFGVLIWFGLISGVLILSDAMNGTQQWGELFDGILHDCAETLRKDPSLERQCGSRLGPTQPGLNYTDLTRRATPADARRRGERKRADGDRQLPEPEVPAPTDVIKQLPSTPTTPTTPNVPLPKVDPHVPNVPLPPLPNVPLPPLPVVGGGGGGNGTSDQTPLLDYLLKP